MSDAKSLVPKWVRGLVGLLALANLGYGLAGYFKPGSMFAALDLASPGAVDAVQQFAARNTAIGAALLIVALAGVPESIAIVMIIRVLIKAQDLILGLIHGASASTLAMAAAFLAIEAFVVVTMFRIVAKRDAGQAL